MGSELESLATTATELVEAAGEASPLGERARRLSERLALGRFYVSVVGEFKRGKSTLVNALLAADALPSGVLPLTAVATEVSFGSRRAVVVSTDGSRHEIAADEIADYVTEERNPANERQVARVEVQLPAHLLEPGVVLVDTPGLGSIYRHNDVEARRALFDADGAILVLSADSPLSAEEHELLKILAERRAPTFFVLNKMDHLGADEREKVRSFVSGQMATELGRAERLWCVSASAALSARLSGRPPEDTACGEFAGLLAALEQFVETDLVSARLLTARRELARLGRALDDAVSLETSALRLEGEELARRVVELQAEAGRQRQELRDERTIFERDVNALMAEVADRLFGFARSAPHDFAARLDEMAASAPVGRLESELRRAVEEAVTEGFERFRQDEAERVESAWRTLAEGLRARTEKRINDVRAAAADLFTVSLPDVGVPEVAAERERFFYLFLKVDPLGEELRRAVSHLLPGPFRRRRLLARARAHLANEFEKHAGRARWDISQRLEGARRRFEVAMSEELEAAVETILAAARRAEELRSASESERERHAVESGKARAAARRALELETRGAGGGEL